MSHQGTNGEGGFPNKAARQGAYTSLTLAFQTNGARLKDRPGCLMLRAAPTTGESTPNASIGGRSRCGVIDQVACYWLEFI